MRAVLAAAAVLGFVGCAADPDDALITVPVTSSAAPTAEAGGPATTEPPSPVVIELFEFQLAAAVIAGQSFTIVNMDGADHTFTDREGDFEAYVRADATATLTVDRPGTYAVWCRIHPSMVGTLVVV
ncbi:MAG: cupredoxin domain-containing protein [Ilumatobacteraceae bacterium]